MPNRGRSFVAAICRACIVGWIVWIVSGPAAAAGREAATTYVGPEVTPQELPIASLSDKNREVWMLVIKRSMMKPGCCGVCARFAIEDARLAWAYVAADRPSARTEAAREAWFRHWRRLSNEFLEFDPGRFRDLYGSWPHGGTR